MVNHKTLHMTLYKGKLPRRNAIAFPKWTFSLILRDLVSKILCPYFQDSMFQNSSFQTNLSQSFSELTGNTFDQLTEPAGVICVSVTLCISVRVLKRMAILVMQNRTQALKQ